MKCKEKKSNVKKNQMKKKKKKMKEKIQGAPILTYKISSEEAFTENVEEVNRFWQNKLQ